MHETPFDVHKIKDKFSALPDIRPGNSGQRATRPQAVPQTKQQTIQKDDC
jgi:hypothetical protein